MKITSVFLVVAAALAGCGESNDKGSDLAMPGVDQGMSDLRPGNDLAVQSCTKIGAWPGLMPTGLYDPDYLGTGGAATVASSRSTAGSTWNRLDIEAWHGRTYPATTKFAMGDLYNDCDTCVVFAENCTDQGCESYYFAQGGTGKIDRADEEVSSGRMTASATGLTLVEWDFSTDAEVDQARCVEIDNASWDVSWFGVDGGTSD